MPERNPGCRKCGYHLEKCSNQDYWGQKFFLHYCSKDQMTYDPIDGYFETLQGVDCTVKNRDGFCPDWKGMEIPKSVLDEGETAMCPLDKGESNAKLA
jgi:hypothetical protein